MILMTTVTTKGQVTIPIDIRDKFDLAPGRKVKFQIKDNDVFIRPVADFADLMGTFPSKKKYSKAAARRAHIKDIIAGKI